jgi:hypothetical protein
MLDVTEIRAALTRIEEHVREAHAAAEVAEEGDPTALQELDGAVDAMAEELAALKAQTASGRF